MNPKLLIVDDDENIRTQMKWALSKHYEILLSEDRASAVAAARTDHPEVVLLDLGLPPHPNDPQEGMAALGEILTADSLLKVIVITGQGEKDNALQAVASGAYDFMVKPIDIEDLRVVLKRALYVSRLEREYREIQRQTADKEGFEGMLGASREIQQVFAQIRKVASTEAPVLILGESGTGKEMVALACHRRSPRKDGPFIAINCSAIPDQLLESELFGHEKGAFTGAHMQRKGRIAMAEGGTLFLDEIGELPPSLQVKLLRFLQDQEIELVGGRTKIRIDARVMAATNTDLKQAMLSGTFREDLYYRLAVVVIRMPPLRNREGDVPLLARTFLRTFAAEANPTLAGFSPKALKALEAYEWPGNVRELENRIKRAVIMAEGRQVTPRDLELDASSVTHEGLNLKEAREAVERELVKRTLRLTNNNMSRAAEELGISRPTLYELIDKLGLKKAAAETPE